MNSDLDVPASNLILGFGNPLKGDDGIGIQAVKMLSERDLPPDTKVMEVRAPGWDLATWFEGCSFLIMIDAVRMGKPPGTWQRLDLEDIKLIPPKGYLSLHEASIREGLLLTQSLNILPEKILFYGLEPGSLSAGQTLSPVVQAALPDLIEEILREIWDGKNEPKVYPHN